MWAMTTACATRGWAASTASISPSSMRYPRILTCSSARPKYRSCPSAPQHTRSPVRYIRVPGLPPNGHATNRDAVNPARRQYPTPTPRTGHIQLTDHTRRHRPQPLVQHKKRRPRHRRTDRRRPRPRRQRRTLRRPHRRLGRAVNVDHHPPRRPPIHHLGRAGLGADHQRRRLQTLGDSTPTAEGVWVSTVTCSRPTTRGSRPVSGPPTRAPPPTARHAAAHPRSPTPRSRRHRSDTASTPARRQLQAGVQRVEQLGDVAVGDRHPLGHTGGARGVDDVGDVIGGRRRQSRAGLSCR